MVLHCTDKNDLLNICSGSYHIGVVFLFLMHVLLLDYELLIIEGDRVSVWENRVAFETFLPKERANLILRYLFVE